MTLLIAFFVGAFAANGVPHFVKGISGEQHQTPFGRPSSPLVNVLWGFANWVIALLLLLLVYHRPIRPLMIGLGVLVMGVILARPRTR